MAVRIRKNGAIVCAAKSAEEEEDTYIDDGLHYVLGVELGVLTVCGVNSDGAELWEFHAPMVLNEKIAKEELALNPVIGFGVLIKDKITGAEGYVVAYTNHMDGTRYYDFQCLELLDGRPSAPVALPECRLEIVNDKRIGFDEKIQN